MNNNYKNSVEIPKFLDDKIIGFAKIQARINRRKYFIKRIVPLGVAALALLVFGLSLFNNKQQVTPIENNSYDLIALNDWSEVEQESIGIIITDLSNSNSSFDKYELTANIGDFN